MFDNISQHPNMAMDIGGNQARLFLMSPQSLTTQVIHSYQYNFTDDLMANLIHNQFAAETVGINPKTANNPMVNSAILPSVNGVPISTRNLSECWTFTILIDVDKATGGTSRTIATGWCRDEPINPTTIHNVTPTLNPNCVLIFTNAMTIDHFKTPNRLPSLGVKRAYDLTPGGYTKQAAAMGSLEIGQPWRSDLMFTDPGGLVKRYEEGEVLSEIVADQTVGAPSAYGDGGPVDAIYHDVRSSATSNKSPKQQLRQIVHAIEQAAAVSDTVNMFSPLSNDFGGADPIGSFNRTVQGNLLGADDFLWSQGTKIIDRPCYIHELLKAFPNIHIHPIVVPKSPQWDVKPQTTMDLQNTYSYLIAQMISSAAEAEGISSIDFRYNSWMGSGYNSSSEAWQINNLSLCVNVDQRVITNILHRFQRIIQFDLAPIIRFSCGEFDINVHYDLNRTLVQLNLLSSPNANPGIFETTSNISGMLIPTIGDFSTFDNNLTQLDSMITIARQIVSENAPNSVYNGNVGAAPRNPVVTVPHTSFKPAYVTEVWPPYVQDTYMEPNKQQVPTTFMDHHKPHVTPPTRHTKSPSLDLPGFQIAPKTMGDFNS